MPHSSNHFVRALGALILLLVLSPGVSHAKNVDLLAVGDWYSLNIPNDGMAYRVSGGVIHIDVRQATDPIYNLQVGHDVGVEVPSGHQVRLRFRARSSTGNLMRISVELNNPPYTPLISLSPTLKDDWQDFDMTAVAPGYPAKGLDLRFQVGQKKGVIEIDGIHLEDLGLDPETAAAEKAVLPAEVAERIDRYRKGDLRVVVKDSQGNAVPGATVEVIQTRHAFKFGCNIFALNPEQHDPSQEAYQQRFAALLNYATLPFYWGLYEPQQGKTDEARLRGMALWCQDHGIEVKGHTLVWQEVYPSWAPNDADPTIQLLHKRVTSLIQGFGDCVHIWDVVNEANAAATFKNGVAAWARRDGPAAEVGTSLDWARQAGKGLDETFVYNDYNTGPANVQLLTDLKAHHQLPDVIGIQSHMHDGNWPMVRVWQTAATFAKFGLPVHFTETTVLSGEHRSVDPSKPPATDWLSTPQGEMEQANYMEQFYSVLFSHPAVQAITYWDFSDNNAWLGAPAGMLRKDMSPKPVYDRLMRLIHQDWWTNVHGTTSGDGAYATRAFFGQYEIVAHDAAGHSAAMSIDFKAGESESVELKLSQ